MTAELISFPVVTIFAREFLEGSVIIGEYRTIILRGGDSLHPSYRKENALRDVTLASLFATALALVVIAAVAIPLAVLSMNFDNSTAKIIEGVSKIVAGVSLLQLSLKLPKFLGLYGSRKKPKTRKPGTAPLQPHADEEAVDNPSQVVDDNTASDESHSERLTKKSIRFNVAWNIWREVAECGVFLIPFFLSGDLSAIPLSAVIGSAVGLAAGFGVYFANKRFKHKKGLAIFAVLLLGFLSAGLFTGGCHNLEVEFGTTPTVWTLQPEFWSVDRLPMTLLKPFGYNDSRTLLGILCFWSWLALSALLHYRKYRISPKVSVEEQSGEADDRNKGSLHSRSQVDTLGLTDSSLEGEYAKCESSSLDGEGTKECTVDDRDTDEDASSAVHAISIASSMDAVGVEATIEEPKTAFSSSGQNFASQEVDL
jgi:high-affinity iron transporter